MQILVSLRPHHIQKEFPLHLVPRLREGMLTMALRHRMVLMKVGGAPSQLLRNPTRCPGATRGLSSRRLGPH
eukprot:3848765-Prorocentrum_lima.AAC.1